MKFETTSSEALHYIAVHWLHSSASDPVELYSELDAAGWERRKIEVFRDGLREYADAEQHTGSTELGEEPAPPISEIAADPQFVPRQITAEEFEALWSTRHNA